MATEDYPQPPEPTNQRPPQRTSQLPRSSGLGRTPAIFILIAILVIALALFFVPFIESETSKYEIVNFQKDNGVGVCELTIRDLGVGGEYYVKFTIQDFFGSDIDDDQGHMDPNTIPTFLSNGHHEIHFCQYDINAPKTTEKKSVFQLLTGS